ncbi:MAG: hypothetical protein GF334_05205 [Candidatus Altiarchaeales archaeon]|nr:hypothetical protein [Candidatus Altiarchaeales archaeon]
MRKSAPKKLKLTPGKKMRLNVDSNGGAQEVDETKSLLGDIGRLEDENRKLRSELKSTRRGSTLFSLLSDTIHNQPPFSTFTPYSSIIQKKGKVKESAMLVLSDSHGDQEILGKRVQNLEEYNFDIACLRAERIVDTTVSHLIDNMKNYKFERLYIAGLGDYVNGDIHNATEHSKWRNSLKNSMGMGELIAMMITDLSRYFPEIVFCSVSGNHGRRSFKKDYRGAQNNWDYLVAMHAATRLRNLVESGRCKIVVPDSWSMGLSVYDWNFVLNHGDDVRSWNSIPHYGIERKTRRLGAIGAVQGTTPNYFLYGHFHTASTTQHTTGEVILNGSWAATDEYALNSLGAYSEPFQWLLGVHPNYGVTWRMPIKLRKGTLAEEAKKKSRYAITLFEDHEQAEGDIVFRERNDKKIYL